MTQHNHAFHEAAISEAGRQYARLYTVLELVRQIAGRERSGKDLALDESARISSAYDIAAPIVQRRFDTLAAEASVWAAAGVDALAAAADPRRQPRAAAVRLADELDQALTDLKKLLRT